MSEWIVIPNWEKFQHRADRSLPWLKLYIELEGRDDWRQLSLAARGLLVCIWIEYRRSKGLLRTSDIPGRVAQKVPRRTLKSLVEAGFVLLSDTQPAQVVDTQLSRARSREVDVDVDEEPLTPQSGATPRELKINPRALGTNPRAVAKCTAPKRKAENWIANGLADMVPPERLGDVIAEEFGIDDPELLEELVTKARAH